MFKSKNHKAFTLVELIVVIVILAILSTIAFLSFNSYSAGARDSVRLGDLNNISKGLVLFYTNSGRYPIPDNYITITASGTNIGYQGYAGLKTLGIINLSNGGKDPLDTNTYYTYNTNINQNKYQLMGFLEDGSNSALSYVLDGKENGSKNGDGSKDRNGNINLLSSSLGTRKYSWGTKGNGIEESINKIKYFLNIRKIPAFIPGVLLSGRAGMTDYLKDISTTLRFAQYDDNGSLINQTYSDSNNYSKRFPYTKGDQLGILLNSGTQVPVQYNSSLTGVNIALTGSNLKIVFSNKEIISQTSTIPLISSVSLYYNLSGTDNMDVSLVGYYDMDNLINSGAKDMGPYGNNSSCVTANLGWATVNGTKSCPTYTESGIRGKAARFSAPPSLTISDYNYLEVVNNLPQLGGLTAGSFSISTWFKTEGIMQDTNDNYAMINIKSSGNICGLGAGAQMVFQPSLGNKMYLITSTTSAGGAGYSVGGTINISSDWNNIVQTYNSSTNEVNIYLNGVLTKKGTLANGVNYYNGTQITLLGAQPNYGCYRSPTITSSATYGYNGLMDEVRIYNRELSAGEAYQIYVNKK